MEGRAVKIETLWRGKRPWLICQTWAALNAPLRLPTLSRWSQMGNIYIYKCTYIYVTMCVSSQTVCLIHGRRLGEFKSLPLVCECVVCICVCVCVCVCVCDHLFALLSRLQLGAGLISGPSLPEIMWQVSLQLTYWWRDWVKTEPHEIWTLEARINSLGSDSANILRILVEARGLLLWTILASDGGSWSWGQLTIDWLQQDSLIYSVPPLLKT